MTHDPLERLTIVHLRGAVRPFQLTFEPGKQLTLIYGPNGTGKSTICDALEFLSKGRIGSLDNRGLGRTNAYWSTVDRSLQDVQVSLATARTNWRATVRKSSVVVAPEATRPRVEVLRRSQMLALLEATPSERYQALRRFVDVAAIEESEQALRQLIRDVKARRELAAARKQEHHATLTQLWQAAGRPGTHPLTWAAVAAQRDRGSATPELEALTALEAAYLQLSAHPARLLDATRALEQAQLAAATAQAETAAQIQAVAQEASATVEVLQAAQRYLHACPEPAACPVCGSSADLLGLAGRVAQRLEAFATLQHALAHQAQAEVQLTQAQQQREAFAAVARADVDAFERARAAFAWSSDVRMPVEAAPHAVRALTAWLAATANLPASWRQVALARQSQHQFGVALKQTLATLQQHSNTQAELDALLPRLERTLEIVAEERRTFVDAMLSTIAAEVARLYEAIHPGEGLNQLTLELDPKKRASLELSSHFASQSGCPPQAYFSQSHLDTLGLCIFLALAKLDQPEDVIIVFDDLLNSVDEEHSDRLMQLLATEAHAFRHCIITTHQRAWREQYHQHWLNAAQSQLIELAPWTITHGMGVVRDEASIEAGSALPS
jgi:energy-coupling factor transporter ATP-binding protein EcfA2